MTRDQQIDLIRQKCISANPEIRHRGSNRLEGLNPEWEIRLSDVLLAIHENQVWQKIEKVPLVLDSGMFGFNRGKGPLRQDDIECTDIVWDLRKDNLTEQSDECLLFIYGLLK